MIPLSGRMAVAVVNLSKLFKDYSESLALSSLVNLYGAIDDHTFVTTSGELLCVISFRGVDPECLEDGVLEAHTAGCTSALRVFDERFVVNTFLLKRSSSPTERSTFQNPVVDEAVKNRHAFLGRKAASLYRFEAFMTVAIKPVWKTPNLVERLMHVGRNPLEALRQSFSTETRIDVLGAEVSRSLRALNQSVSSFLQQTADHLEARLLHKTESFLFFRRLLNPDPLKASAVPLTHDDHVGYFAVDSELQCYRDHLRLDNYFLKVLTLKQHPLQTFANVFSHLQRINADLVVVTEWNPLDAAKALADIRSKRRHSHNTKVSLFSQIGSERPYERELLFDDSKEAVVAELGDALKAHEMRGVQFGEFSLTVLILANSLEEAERVTAEVMKVVGVHDGALNEERYNGLNAFLAALPGGHPYNLRKTMVTNENHSDMVSWFQPAEGERENKFLRAGYLAAFETEDSSLYHFNLHVQDVGHTLVLGPTGKGKSFLLNFLIAHAQQYEPHSFIFDVGGSYRWLTELFGGSYVAFRPDERSFSINPFSLEPTAENFEFQFAFVKLLVESDQHRMSDAEERDLFDSIRALPMLPPEHRRLLSLYTTVTPKVGAHIKRWTQGEQHGQWFDNVEDNVSFARFQCINFEGMERLGLVLEPLMFYLLHRANEVIYDQSLSTVFKLAVVDEAWLFFKNPITQEYIANAMRTWRKKNAAMVLCTQSPRDLSGTEVFRPLVESCPTKLLLSNPDLDAAFYVDALRLNAAEVQKVRALLPKRQFLLKREGLSKVLNLNVDPKSYWLFTTDPYEAKRRQELVNQVGLEAALDILGGESR
jgi:type IV secretion/conjugal transfer VirB4 family ATPase